MTALAVGTCSLTALDTVAGLGTQVTLTNCGSSASVSMLVRGPSDIDYTQNIVLDQSGNATTLVPSLYTQTAGIYQVIATGQTNQFSVIADRADDAHSSLSVSPKTIRASTDRATVTALLRDKFDNPVIGRPMALISNRTTDDIVAKSAQTDENGRFIWTARATEGGQMTLVPYDILSGRQLKMKADIAVSGGTSSFKGMLTGFEQGGDLAGDLSNGIIDSLEISLPQNATSVNANELFSMTIRAMYNGGLERSYIGTLIVESSDPDADLPKKGEDPNSPKTGRIDVRSVDQGVRSVPLSFLLRAKGPQTISVYDKNDPSVRGSITINVLRGAGSASNTITIIDPKDRSSIKGHSVLLQGRAPSLINLIVKGGANTIAAESDEEGVFRVSVPLNESDREATLFVTSENGTYESEPIHIFVDTEAPTIDTITFDPPEGRSGETATITVKSEANLQSVTAGIGGEIITLTASGTLYTGTIKAPNNTGTHDVKVIATDSVGFQTTMLTKWGIKPTVVPVVQGVRAEAKPYEVLLNWTPLQGVEVKEYKVYIAKNDDPTNYLYSVSTNQNVTSAVIKDLPVGAVYQFSLTAVNTDNLEGAEKSAPVIASPLGLELHVKSGQDSLMVEWNKIPDLPMSKYILEFRAEDTEMAYQKIDIKGEAVTHMLTDLINGLSYEIKLTPVTITGKLMPDLTATAYGTPNGAGFIATTSDPAPPDLLHPGANLHPPPNYDVPSTPGSGIPSMLIGLLIVASIVIGFFARSYMKQRRMAQEFLQLMQNRYHQS